MTSDFWSRLHLRLSIDSALQSLLSVRAFLGVAVAHVLLPKESKQICCIKRERQTCCSICVRPFADSSVLKGRL